MGEKITIAFLDSQHREAIHTAEIDAELYTKVHTILYEGVHYCFLKVNYRDNVTYFQPVPDPVSLASLVRRSKKVETKNVST